ncbi:Epsin-3, clathrin recruitment and traffic between the Golgi and endosome [Lecanora helva]
MALTASTIDNPHSLELANVSNSQLLNEIMPMIYKRFTEKAAEEWRQIYKSLQLLEFLIKNGSERVIDDARSHLSLLKMLRQFHYIDQNGKDQGVNVRNRSKELAELLGDVDRIRAERKKARANRNKFGGVEGGTMSGGMSGSSRYGGFGSESGGYGSSSTGVYGDGGGFGGNTSDFQDSRRNDRFDEYDEYDEGPASSSTRRKTGTTATEPVRAKKPDPPKPKEPEIDILAFDDDVPPETPPKEVSNGRKATTNALENDEDDFDDFQSASPTTAASKPTIPNLAAPMSANTASSAQFAAPQPIAPAQNNDLSDLFSSVSPPPSAASGMVSPPAPNYNISSPSAASAFQSPAPIQQQAPPQQPRPTCYQAAAPNYFTSVQAAAPATQTPSAPNSRPSMTSTDSFSKPAAKPGASGGDAFASLWSSTSAGAGIKKTPTPSSGGPKLADMQKQKAAAGIWGAPAASSAAAPMQQSTQSNGQKSGGGGGAFDDLLG